MIIVGNNPHERKFTLKGGTKEEPENVDSNKTTEADIRRKPAVKRTHSEDSDSSRSDFRLRQKVERKVTQAKRQKVKESTENKLDPPAEV